MKSILLLFLLASCTACFGWGFTAHWQISVAALNLIDSSTLNSIRGNVQEDVFKNWIGVQASCVDLDRYFVKDLVPAHTFIAERYVKIESLALQEILDIPGMKRNAMGALIEAFLEIREHFLKKNFPDLAFAIARLFHFGSDLMMPLHVVRNSDGQLTDQPGMHFRIESIAGTVFFGMKQLTPESAIFLQDFEIPEFILNSISQSASLASTFEAADKKRLSDSIYDYSELWEEISPAFTEAVNRAVFVCASLLKSAILGIEETVPASVLSDFSSRGWGLVVASRSEVMLPPAGSESRWR
ncbi:MAG: hypothetical protein PHD38_03580 [Mesotoga sp.]|uniref:hypothetical protein n=1 Tax=unclassified Mesotoga TaxID=1184398 RepID=UPI000FF37A43|nr:MULTISPECIES: hypothetical protein [unclassified Mesotoga]MDI9369232.1 hypothetical protein [Thermotogota bacterium]MDD2333463.1 hypothetical protein [Mesotoga sp.]MDD3681612.1 hypothetical protein [Mesotoga sp.]MDD4207323.1 hypothetical protein [Mesotoga sp.]MDD4826086.1 hypothetical protein [Mesotoga sp.]